MRIFSTIYIDSTQQIAMVDRVVRIVSVMPTKNVSIKFVVVIRMNDGSGQVIQLKMIISFENLF